MTQKKHINTIEAEQIPEIRKTLKALAKMPPKHITPKMTVRLLLPEIQEARAAGHTYDEITAQIADHGVRISGATLGSYVREAKRENAAEQAEQRRSAKTDEAAAEDATETPAVADSPASTDGIVFVDLVDDPEEDSDAATDTQEIAVPLSSDDEDDLNALLDGLDLGSETKT